MEMTNKENTLEINRLPSITWNWMKMNKDLLTMDFQVDSYTPDITVPEAAKSQADISKSIDELTSKPGFSVFCLECCESSYDKAATFIESRRNNFKDKICTAAGEGISEIIEENSNPVIITANGKIQEPIVIEYNQEKDSKTTSSQIIHAFPDTECTIIYLFESNDQEESFSALRTQVYAEEGAKVHIVKVQLLGDQAHQIDDTSFICGDRAEAQFTQIELGGCHVDSALNTMLSGYKSNFKSHVAYLCINDQYLDMNHVVLHRGKKTDCNMQVDGTLRDKSQKIYKGTIDFQNGCSGSTGNEMEETLLLTPTVINKSLPVILCDEEDVEGEHGATLGRLSSDILFYLQTRGIDQKGAEKLMAKAKIKRASANIQDEEINNKISQFINDRI